MSMLNSPTGDGWTTAKTGTVTGGVRVLLLCGAFSAAGMGTSADRVSTNRISDSGTDAGRAAPAPAATPSTAAAIAEIRRSAGLTWQQVADLFETSRRSVHFWASGKPMSEVHEARLFQVLDWVRSASARGETLRARLLAGSTPPIEGFEQQLYSEVADTLGRPANAPRQRSPLSTEAATSRRPSPPADRVQDVESPLAPGGRGRAVQAVRVKSRGPA